MKLVSWRFLLEVKGHQQTCQSYIYYKCVIIRLRLSEIFFFGWNPFLNLKILFQDTKYKP